MKNRRIYNFDTATRTRQPDARVRDLLIDGWSAYYRWLDRLKKRQASKRPK